MSAFENGKYLKVGTDAGDLEADYKLAIDIRKFRVTTSPVPPVAEVELSAKLLDADGKIADARIFSATSPLTVTNNPAVAAKALDTAFGAVATDLVVWTLNAENASTTAAGVAAP